MTQAIRDNNRRTVWLGVSSVDGVTPIPIKTDSGGAMKMEFGTSIMPTITIPVTTDKRDENFVKTLGGVSSANSAVLIPISVNPATGAVQAIL